MYALLLQINKTPVRSAQTGVLLICNLILLFYQCQIPLHNRRRQQEFLFHTTKAYRDHIRLDSCYRANAKRLMLDLDTNLDFGNIHLDRRFWLSG